jgi:hypothetical protein
MRGRLASASFALRLDTSLELAQQSDGGVPGAQALLAPLALTLRLELSEAMTRLAQDPHALPPRNAPLLLDSLLEVAETAAHPPREVAQGRRELLLESGQRARVASLCARLLLCRSLAPRTVRGGVRTSRGRRRCQVEILPGPLCSCNQRAGAAPGDVDVTVRRSGVASDRRSDSRPRTTRRPVSAPRVSVTTVHCPLSPLRS